MELPQSLTSISRQLTGARPLWASWWFPKPSECPNLHSLATPVRLRGPLLSEAWVKCRNTDSGGSKVWFTPPPEKHAHSSVGSWISSGSRLSWNLINRQANRKITKDKQRERECACGRLQSASPHLDVNLYFQNRTSVHSPVPPLLQAPQASAWANKNTRSPVLLLQFRTTSAQQTTDRSPRIINMLNIGTAIYNDHSWKINLNCKWSWIFHQFILPLKTNKH